MSFRYAAYLQYALVLISGGRTINIISFDWFNKKGRDH